MVGRITVGGVARAVGAVPVTEAAAEVLQRAVIEARTRALTASLVEGLPTAVWCITLSGNVEIQNAAARRLAGALLEMHACGVVERIAGRPFMAVSAQPEPELWDARSSCGTISYHLRSEVVELDGVRRLTVTAADVTRERAMLVRLADAERRAAVGVLGAGVAHEINNPLGFVMANVRCLGEYLEELAGLAGPAGAAVGADAPALLAETTEGLERIRAIVRELLHFSSRGPASAASMRSLALAEVVDQALRLAGHEVLRRGARVLRLDQPAPRVTGCEHQLGDVVVDLLVNAVDAVTDLSPERRAVEVRTYGAGRLAVLEIQDRGVGIPAHVMPRVFDPFFTTKGAERGTGLGLSIASEIVRRHGGELVLTSREGEGTLVRVEIPGER